MKRCLTVLLILIAGASMKTSEQEFLRGIIEEGDRKFASLGLEEHMASKIQVRIHNAYAPYSFAGHEPLRWIARKLGNARHLVAMKAAQVGWSTFMIVRGLWLVDGEYLHVAFFFPNQQAMIDFVQYRFDPIIDNSPYYAKLRLDMGGVDNVKIKQIGKMIIAFRATSTMTGVKSFDSDVNIEDEVDEHNPETLQFTRDRLLHSRLGYVMSGSQPSIEDYGIHAAFMESDQHWWHARCGCGTWTNPVATFMEDPEKLFAKNNKGDVFYACPSCRKKLNMQRGEYVPAVRGREIAGVQLSHLFFDYISARDMQKKFLGANTLIKRKNFYISVIGVPYSTDDEKPITQGIIESHRSDHALRDRSEFYTYMGADQGDVVHMVFGEPTRDGRIAIIGLQKFSVLDEEAHRAAIRRMCVFQGIVDAMPNKNWAVRMAMAFPENIRIQYFAKKYAEKAEAIPGLEEGIEVMQANRDESLQDTVDAVKRGLFIFPDKSRLDGPDLALAEEFDYHLRMLIRERGEDDNGKPIYQFKKKVPNHFGMALNSLRLAYESAGSPGVNIDPIYG